jgi:hypothetical protein
MTVPMNMKHPRACREVGRAAGVGGASAAVLAVLAVGAGTVFAANSIKAGVGGTTIIVNGRTISTSNLTLAELAKLQGVPESNVNLELDGVAAGNPAAPAVEALVGSLTGQTTLATALNELSAASGTALNPASQSGVSDGAIGPAPVLIPPATALEEVVLDNGRPGASNGSIGGAGVNGSHARVRSVEDELQPARCLEVAEGTSALTRCRAVQGVLCREARLQRHQTGRRFAEGRLWKRRAGGQAAGQAGELPVQAQGAQRDRRQERSGDGEAARLAGRAGQERSRLI